MKKNINLLKIIFLIFSASALSGCGFFWGSFSGGDNYFYKQVTAGNDHACALTTTGRVRCWGSSSDGQLGYGNANTIGDNELPYTAGDVNVGGFVTQICAGYIHTCALLNTGAVRCWGDAPYGQLGNNDWSNDIGNNETPASVGDIALGGTATQIACEGYSTCVLLTTGNVRCFGLNGSGNLGYNNTTDVGNGIGPSILVAGDVPVGAAVSKIAMGGSNTCAILTDGNVRCWGTGGRNGNNSAVNVGDGVGPTIIANGNLPLGGTATQIGVGNFHSCALLTTGAVRCWGEDGAGQLGYGVGNIGDGVGPSIIATGDANLGGTVSTLVVGDQINCAILASGQMKCWGYSFEGEIGINVSSASRSHATSSPVFLGTGLTFRQVDSGFRITCAITSADRVRCWGSGASGKTGYGSTNDISDGIGLTIPQAGDIRIFE